MKEWFKNLGRGLLFCVIYWIASILIANLLSHILHFSVDVQDIIGQVLRQVICGCICAVIAYLIVSKTTKQSFELIKILIACVVIAIVAIVPAIFEATGYATNSWVLDVIAAPCASSALYRAKKRKTGEETTLYQKDRIIQKGSKAAGYRVALIITLWIMGFIALFSGMLPFGLVLLAAAFGWTKQLVDRNRIENYQKIVTPAHWPKDCQYENYNQGLRPEFGGSSFSKEKQFYLRCSNEGITDITSTSGSQKALLIAQKMKFKKPTIESIRTAYKEGKTAAERELASSKDLAHTQTLSKIRIEELNVLAGAMRYYGLHGKEKRIAMLKDMREELKKQIREAKNMESYATYGMMQKEHDWAIHGGIASGIAGPAAGLVTAMQIESKNAAIREYNAQIAPYALMIARQSRSKASSLEITKDRYTTDINKTELKLISDDPTEKVFENLSIQNMTYAVSETGAVVVEADFDVDAAYRIFGDMKPTIDGVVAVRLMENGNHVGSAYFVLPVDGVHSKIRLASICTKTTNPDAKYTMEYAPVDLWAIEKL